MQTSQNVTFLNLTSKRDDSHLTLLPGSSKRKRRVVHNTLVQWFSCNNTMCFYEIQQLGDSARVSEALLTTGRETRTTHFLSPTVASSSAGWSAPWKVVLKPGAGRAGLGSWQTPCLCTVKGGESSGFHTVKISNRGPNAHSSAWMDF